MLPGAEVPGGAIAEALLSPGLSAWAARPPAPFAVPASLAPSPSFMDPREAQDGSSPELGRRRQLSVGELCSLFEARCAMASRQLPEPARKTCRPRNGVLQAVIPQLTVTSEEDGGEAQRSPAMLPPTEPNGAWLTTDSSLHLLQSSRRLSTSSLSSTGSSSVFEDSEDDLLSDTEGRSQGIVHLEHGEETHQVPDGAGEEPGETAAGSGGFCLKRGLCLACQQRLGVDSGLLKILTWLMEGWLGVFPSLAFANWERAVSLFQRKAFSPGSLRGKGGEGGFFLSEKLRL